MTRGSMIHDLEKVKKIIFGNETKLILYSIDYSNEIVREHIFFFSDNKTIGDYIIVKSHNADEIFLEKNDPSSRYFETAFKIDDIPLRYSRNFYDPSDINKMCAIAINQKGDYKILSYSSIAKGFGCIGYIAESKQKDFYLNKEQANFILEQYLDKTAEDALKYLLKKYPRAKKFLNND